MAQSFSFEQSCVIFTDDISPATNRKMPRLFVQCIDAYRYQREFSVALSWEPGNSRKLFWEAHTYKHPGQRCVVRLTAPQALKVIERILDLSSHYPSLLFNAANDNGRARAEGFVHFHDACLAGNNPADEIGDI